MVAIAFVPLILAIGLYFSQSWSPSGRVNEGTLYTPPLTLSALLLKNSRDQKAEDLIDEKKWQLLFITSEMNDQTLESLHLMRQVHKALGKNQNRIERNLVTLTPPANNNIQTLVIDYPNMRQLFTQESDLQQFFSKNQPQVPALFICDPLGNIMLSYQLEQIGKPLLKDLKKLLKLSKIG